jgi:hypothetical protein
MPAIDEVFLSCAWRLTIACFVGGFPEMSNVWCHSGKAERSSSVRLDSHRSRQHGHARCPAVGYARYAYEASWNEVLKWLPSLQACN